MSNDQPGGAPAACVSGTTLDIDASPRRSCRQTGIAQSGLKVRFEEPEVLVEFAGHGRE
jgi:hypothetical protein